MSVHGFRDPFEYDSFNYGDEGKVLSLDEALKTARAQSAQDPVHYYRVIPIDETMRNFRIQKVAKHKVHAKQRARFVARMADVFSHSYGY